MFKFTQHILTVEIAWPVRRFRGFKAARIGTLADQEWQVFSFLTWFCF
jgi:hypothetical protein